MNFVLCFQPNRQILLIQHSHLNPPAQLRLVYCPVEEPGSSPQHHLPDLLKKNCRQCQLGLLLQPYQRQDQEGYLALFHPHLPLLQSQDSLHCLRYQNYQDFQ